MMHLSAPRIMDLNNQLNASVLDLRQPSVDVEQRRNKLKKVAYYLPQVKNPQNLWLILNELASSPRFITLNEAEDLPVVQFAVDAITFAANRKARISDPTLSYAEWENASLKLAYQSPPLFGLIVVSGLCAHGTPAEQELPKFIEAVVLPRSAENSQSSVTLAAACLARAQWSPKVQTSIYSHLTPLCRSELLAAILRMVYNHETVSSQSPHISIEFGGWSRTISSLLEFASFPELMRYIQNLQIFIRTAASSDPPLESMKKLSFGVIVQLEGLMSQVVVNFDIHKKSRALIVCNVSQAMQPSGCVFEEVGSQFSSYQFVFNSSLDALQSVTPWERAEVVRVLGDQWRYGQVLTSNTGAGELLVFFEISEPLMPVLSGPEAETLVISIAQRFLEPVPAARALQINLTSGPAVFEAAHSVMLAYLATHTSQQFEKSDVALIYFDKIQPSFPTYLSARQLRTAVEAISNAVDHTRVRLILQRIFEMGKSTMPGVPIPTKDEEKAPPTLRAALVSTSLHGVAQHATAPEMAVWLPRIGGMVPEPYTPGTQQERDYSIQDIKDVITNLGDLADVGIKWFFNNGWSRL